MRQLPRETGATFSRIVSQVTEAPATVHFHATLGERGRQRNRRRVWAGSYPRSR